MKTLCTLVLCSSVSVMAQESLAEVGTTHSDIGHYSVLTGRTVGEGNLVFHPEIGYPALSLSVLSGMQPGFDFGGRFTFGYGSRTGFALDVGAGAQAIFRFNYVNTGMISFGMRLEPGLLVGAGGPGTALVIVPVGFDLGIHPHPIVAVAFGADIGLGVAAPLDGSAAGFVMPIAVGPGVELNLTRDLQLTFDTRFGGGLSMLDPYRGFALKFALGLAFRT